MHRADCVGYRIIVIYLILRSPELAVVRVKTRVRAGGHDVPDADIRRRLIPSRMNLEPALKLAHRAYVFDNSSTRRTLLAIVKHQRLAYFASHLPWLRGMLMRVDAAADPARALK